VIRSPDQILTLTGQQMILHPSGKGTLSSFGTACAPPSLGNKKGTCIRLYRYPKIHASQIHFPLQGDSDISNLAGIGICTVGSPKQEYAKKTDGSPADCIKNPLF